MSMERRQFFDNLARQWDEEHHTPEEHERTAKFVREHLRAAAGESVLDVGCGTGRLAPFLLEMLGAGGRLAALDISEEMLRIPRRRYPFPNVLFIQGDGHRLPFKYGSMDAVICFAFFPHLTDKEMAMKEFAAVLKPGGRLIIAHQMNREELNRLHGSVNGPVKRDVLPAEAEMRCFFANAGFRGVEFQERSGLYWARGVRIGGE